MVTAWAPGGLPHEEERGSGPPWKQSQVEAEKPARCAIRCGGGKLAGRWLSERVAEWWKNSHRPRPAQNEQP